MLPLVGADEHQEVVEGGAEVFAFAQPCFEEFVAFFVIACGEDVDGPECAIAFVALVISDGQVEPGEGFFGFALFGAAFGA